MNIIEIFFYIFTIRININTINSTFVIKINEPCLNGTERICRVLDQISPLYNIIVNEEDESFIDPENIDYAIEKYLDNEKYQNMVCTTLHYEITNKKELYNRIIGKMVLDKYDNVLYCSHSLILHTKSGDHDPNLKYIRHVSVFIFRRSYLGSFLSDKNTPAQLAEDIEWLKIIESEYKIKLYYCSKNY